MGVYWVMHTGVGPPPPGGQRRTVPDRKMRLSFVVDSENFGGAEMYAVHLLRRFANWFDCALLVSSPVAPYFRARLSQVRLKPVPLARHRATCDELAEALVAEAPDMVHLNLVDLTSNAAALQAALVAAPTSATVHLPAVGIGSLETVGPLYRRLGHVVAASRSARSTVVKAFGLDPHRVTVIRNGIDIAARPPVRCRRGVPRVGVVARLTEQKGIDVLLDAIAMLCRRGRRFDVVVAGEGRDRAPLERQARGLPVRFVGFIDDIPRLLAGLDLFCLPSRHEALPLAVLEAMAVGLPCILTDVGDIAEAVGEAALVVPPEDPTRLADALEALLLNPLTGRRLGQLARRRAVTAFNADRMAHETASIVTALAMGAAAVPQLR